MGKPGPACRRRLAGALEWEYDRPRGNRTLLVLVIIDAGGEEGKSPRLGRFIRFREPAYRFFPRGGSPVGLDVPASDTRTHRLHRSRRYRVPCPFDTTEDLADQLRDHLIRELDARFPDDILNAIDRTAAYHRATAEETARWPPR